MTKIESPYPQALTQKEMIEAFQRGGYRYKRSDFVGGAKLIGHTKIGYPIYEIQFINDAGKIETGKAYGEYRNQLLQLDH
jgi:hypothetical protein